MDSYEFNVNEKLRPSVERTLTGTTKLDSDISNLAMPKERSGVRAVIVLLRLYRRLAPRAMRNKCVFDPSCSHYSELAFRQNSLMTGIKLTLNRLARCKPGNGGVDLINIENWE